MIKLNKRKYKFAYALYKEEKFFFPLIAAILFDEQDGVVYVDDADSPSQVYVEHAFGFAQLIGRSNSIFTQELEAYLLTEKKFNVEKVRLYSPSTPDFLMRPRNEASLSQRQRFHLDYDRFLARKKSITHSDISYIQLSNLGFDSLDLIINKFKVVSNFWRSQDDFVGKAMPCLVSYKNEPASICYSAATADGCAEIDILTLPKFRNLGLAGFALTKFIENCHDSAIRPLWDCFANNAASMAIAKSLGFIPYNAPYKFFTINK